VYDVEKIIFTARTWYI